MRQNAAVIGGGISGLASALRIAQQGPAVTLFEADDVLGGLGTTFPYHDAHLERFYHCILPNDGALLEIIRQLGLEPELLWRKCSMGFMYRRHIYPLNTLVDLLGFTPLAVHERLRMGFMGVRARFAGLDPALDGLSAENWVRGLAGDRAFEILWRPLLSAKIGDQYGALPALWLSSRMNREKNIGLERKGCLRGGYRSLIDAFERALLDRNVDIRMRTRVGAIERDGERMRLRLASGSTESFDVVVSTLPLVQFQQMTRTLPIPAEMANLSLDYQGVVSGVFLTEKPLTRHFWIPFVDSGVTTQGVIEMSNLVPLERAHGLHVNYFVNYTHRDSELFRMSDPQILALYRHDLETLFPEAAATVRDAFLFRAPYVEPIWPLHYSRKICPTSVIPGRLYLACTAQVYPRVNSWNSCCEVVDAMMTRFTAECSELPDSRRLASA